VCSEKKQHTIALYEPLQYSVIPDDTREGSIWRENAFRPSKCPAIG